MEITRIILILIFGIVFIHVFLHIVSLFTTNEVIEELAHTGNEYLENLGERNESVDRVQMEIVDKENRTRDIQIDNAELRAEILIEKLNKSLEELELKIKPDGQRNITETGGQRWNRNETLRNELNKSLQLEVNRSLNGRANNTETQAINIPTIANIEAELNKKQEVKVTETGIDKSNVKYSESVVFDEGNNKLTKMTAENLTGVGREDENRASDKVIEETDVKPTKHEAHLTDNGSVTEGRKSTILTKFKVSIDNENHEPSVTLPMKTYVSTKPLGTIGSPLSSITDKKQDIDMKNNALEVAIRTDVTKPSHTEHEVLKPTMDLKSTVTEPTNSLNSKTILKSLDPKSPFTKAIMDDPSNRITDTTNNFNSIPDIKPTVNPSSLLQTTTSVPPRKMDNLERPLVDDMNENAMITETNLQNQNLLLTTTETTIRVEDSKPLKITPSTEYEKNSFKASKASDTIILADDPINIPSEERTSHLLKEITTHNDATKTTAQVEETSYNKIKDAAINSYRVTKTDGVTAKSEDPVENLLGKTRTDNTKTTTIPTRLADSNTKEITETAATTTNSMKLTETAILTNNKTTERVHSTRTTRQADSNTMKLTEPGTMKNDRTLTTAYSKPMHLTSTTRTTRPADSNTKETAETTTTNTIKLTTTVTNDTTITNDTITATTAYSKPVHLTSIATPVRATPTRPENSQQTKHITESTNDTPSTVYSNLIHLSSTTMMSNSRTKTTGSNLITESTKHSGTRDFNLDMNNDQDKKNDDNEFGDNLVDQIDTEPGSNVTPNSPSTPSPQNRSTRPRPKLRIRSRDRAEENFYRQYLRELVLLIDAIDADKVLDGLIIISSGEEFKHVRTRLREWKNMTQIHLDHVPKLLHPPGNKLRTLSLIVVDNNLNLLRDLATASENFFSALHPTVAILIVLPNCHQQIRDTLSAFILLRLWRQQGLYKLIVVCHRRFYPWKNEGSEQVKEETFANRRFSTTSTAQTKEESFTNKYSTTSIPVDSNQSREEQAQPELKLQKYQPILENTFIETLKRLLKVEKEGRHKRAVQEGTESLENSRTLLDMSVRDEQDMKTGMPDINTNIRTTQNVTLNRENIPSSNRENDVANRKEPEQQESSEGSVRHQNTMEGNMPDENNNVQTTISVPPNRETVSANRQTVSENRENDSLNRESFPPNRETDPNITTTKSAKSRTGRKKLFPTSCGFLVWIFNPFKSCMKERLNDQLLAWLQEYMASLRPNLDALGQRGAKHLYLKQQPHLDYQLSFGPNFNSVSSSDERDDKCRKVKPLWGTRPGKLAQVFRTLHDRLLNMQGCQFDLSIYHRMPTAMISENGTKIEGMDAEIMFMLAKGMNFTPKIHIGDRIIYGMGTSLRPGTFIDVLDRKVDMNINGHFVKSYNETRLAFTRFITNDIVCLLLPKAPRVSPLETVLLSFHWPVWIALVVTFVILVTLYYLWWYVIRERFEWKQYHPISSHRDAPILLELYRTMLYMPSSTILSLSADYRILLAFLYAFSFIVTNAFQGSLFTFISTPVYYPDINTFTQLENSDLPLRTSSYGWDELFKEDPILETLGKRLEHHNESQLRVDGSHYVGFQRLNTHWRHIFHDVRMRVTTNLTRMLHVMDEHLINYFISYVLLRESPYRARIDQLLSYMDQAGLAQKWMATMDRTILTRFTPVGHTVEKKATFRLQDLRAPFMLLLGGLVLSGIVLGMELVVNKVSRRHSDTMHKTYRSRNGERVTNVMQKVNYTRNETGVMQRTTRNQTSYDGRNAVMQKASQHVVRVINVMQKANRSQNGAHVMHGTTRTRNQTSYARRKAMMQKVKSSLNVTNMTQEATRQNQNNEANVLMQKANCSWTGVTNTTQGVTRKNVGFCCSVKGQIEHSRQGRIIAAQLMQRGTRLKQANKM